MLFDLFSVKHALGDVARTLVVERGLVSERRRFAGERGHECSALANERIHGARLTHAKDEL